jgi:hypothetical protein
MLGGIMGYENSYCFNHCVFIDDGLCAAPYDKDIP